MVGKNPHWDCSLSDHAVVSLCVAAVNASTFLPGAGVISADQSNTLDVDPMAQDQPTKTLRATAARLIPKRRPIRDRVTPALNGVDPRVGQ
jgi:hypothetical protein